MKILLIILFPLFSFAQKDTTIEISVANQKGVTGYVLETSKNGSTWNTSYSFNLPVSDGVYNVPVRLNSNYYYRIHVLGRDQYSDVKIFQGVPLAEDRNKIRITRNGAVYE